MVAPATSTQRVEITEAFSYGWRKLMKEPAPWLIVAAVGVVSGALLSALGRIQGLGFVFNLAQFVVSGVLGYVLTAMALEAVRGRPVRIVDPRERLNVTVTYIVATFLYTIGVLFASVLLIVPGIMFAVAYYFYAFIIVDTEADPIEAFKQARTLSRGHRWPLFGAGLLAILVTILGALAFGIGLIVAIPLNAIAGAHIYSQLRGHAIVE